MWSYKICTYSLCENLSFSWLMYFFKRIPLQHSFSLLHRSSMDPQSQGPHRRVFGHEDLANLKSKSWVIIDGLVYDLARFDHPGGNVISSKFGSNASLLFHSTHNPDHLTTLNKYVIGGRKQQGKLWKTKDWLIRSLDRCLDAWMPGLVNLPANISRVLVVTQDSILVLQRTARVSSVVNSIRGQVWLANVRLTAVLMWLLRERCQHKLIFGIFSTQ